jgi:ribosomal protein S5
MTEIRSKFEQIDECPVQGKRVFFENAGGALTLKSVVKCSMKYAAIPDNQGRDNDGAGEVMSAINKAKEDMRIFMNASSGQFGTIPHKIVSRYGSSQVMLGVIAGAAVRAVMEQVGVQNILTKRFGSNNQMNVTKATMKALTELQDVVSVAAKRGITVKEVFI